MSEKEYKVSRCAVAFIDVLGSSDAILQDEEKSLNTIHKAYTESVLHIFKYYRYRKKADMKPKVKIFSDNIVIGVPYEEKWIDDHVSFEADMSCIALSSAVALSANIQEYLFKRGWLVRGGITLGNFFTDNIMVWGSGLLRAYKLESTVAFFPRIVIDPTIAEKFAFFSTQQTAKHRYMLEEYIRKDADGLYSVEFLNKYLELIENPIEQFFDKQLDMVQEQLKKYKNKTNVYQKWLWAYNYVQERRIVLTKGNDHATSDEGQRG